MMTKKMTDAQAALFWATMLTWLASGLVRFYKEVETVRVETLVVTGSEVQVQSDNSYFCAGDAKANR